VTTGRPAAGPGDLVEQALRHHRAGARPQAERLYREALAARPDDPRARFLLGTLLAQGGAVAEAAEHFARAARADPGNADAHAHLGTALAHLGRGAEAEAALSRALALAPDHPVARFNLGVVCTEAGDLEAAEGHFRHLLDLRPEAADARLNLGEVLRRRCRYAEALEVLREGVRRHPDAAPLWVTLGQVLQLLGQRREADAAYAEAVRAAPGDDAVWSSRLFASLYQPDLTAAEVADRHRAWGARHAGRAHPPARPADPDPERVLKVGYLSPDLREHPVAFFLEPLLAHHDAAQVHVTCYSGVTRPDRVTGQLRALVPGWREVAGLSDADLAARIRADGIDVLVDLAGHTAGGRLPALALRSAPVQVSYLGYAATTGLEAVDYRVTDAACDPPGTESLYTERLWRLEGAFCAYAPKGDAPPVAPLPALAAGHVTFGSLINPVKLNDGVAALWGRVLAAVPDARLSLFCTQFRSDALRDAVRGLFARAGADTARLDLAWELDEGAGYLSRYHVIDLCLDTVPFCGHTTTCEALWMGVPTVTLAGGAFAGRMGASLLRTVGLADLVAADADAFVAAAARLVGDIGALSALRAGMRERVRTSPLCDGAALAARVEAAYRGMWRQACARTAPAPGDAP